MKQSLPERVSLRLGFAKQQPALRDSVVEEQRYRLECDAGYRCAAVVSDSWIDDRVRCRRAALGPRTLGRFSPRSFDGGLFLTASARPRRRPYLRPLPAIQRNWHPRQMSQP